MSRKYIKDLTTEELIEVYFNNEKLQDMVKSEVLPLEPNVSENDYGFVDYFCDHYAYEHLSEDAFIQGDDFTLYEQRTYNFDEGIYTNCFEDVKDKVNQKELEM